MPKTIIEPMRIIPKTMGEFIYARRDMRSDHGILWNYRYGWERKSPTWAITKEDFMQLCPVDQNKFVRIKNEWW